MKTFRNAAVAGLMVWLGACTGSPSGLHNGATFSGTLSSSQGGTIANATVTVTPSGGSALAGVQTDGSGAYTVDGVPAGDGSITVSNVPSNCQAPSALPYSGAKNGGHSVHNLTAPCGSTTLP